MTDIRPHLAALPDELAEALEHEHDAAALYLRNRTTKGYWMRAHEAADNLIREHRSRIDSIISERDRNVGESTQPPTEVSQVCPACEGKDAWRITVGGGYGEFLFYGTEDEAEEMRRHKALWEHVIARKERVGCPNCHGTGSVKG